jgi:hypothetical protein
MQPSPMLPVMAVTQLDTRNSDVATEQTIRLMCGHVYWAAKNPLVQQVAAQALDAWSGRARLLGLSPMSPGGACFWLAKHFCKQVPHSEFKALLAAYPQKRQLLVSPEALLRAESPAGDCSTFSMLIAAMLEALGERWEFVTVAADPEDPSLYSHVFVRAVSSDGTRQTLDGSHGKYPGWEVPRAQQFRRQVWNSDGEPISDLAPFVSQLHAYQARPGLGDDSSTDLSGSLSEITGGDSSTDLSGSFSEITGGNTSGALNTPESAFTAPVGSVLVNGVYGSVAPSQSSANWASSATALAKSGMTLAEINAIQPGTVVGANGQLLRQATGFPVPVGTGITAALGSNSSGLLIGGLIAAALFFVMISKRS